MSTCMYMYTFKLHRLMLIRKMKKIFHDYQTYSLNLYVEFCLQTFGLTCKQPALSSDIKLFVNMLVSVPLCKG